MTAENRLRDLLRSEADTIHPTGDGLARIRERVARRRRVRFWLLPSAAVATAAAAAAFVLVAPDHPQTQTLQPGETPSSTATATTEPTGSPAPAVPDDGGMPLDRAAIWPFTSPSQLASWQTQFPYAENSLEVTRHFVADYLGLSGVQVTQTCISCGVLQLDVGGKSVGEVTTARLGVGFASGDGKEIYTVVGVTGGDLTITSPAAGAQVSSPMTVTGRITGVDEHVAVRLLDEKGNEVAQDGARAGSAMPWSATLRRSRSDWTHGGLVGVTRSAKDGAVNRVVAVPVSRAVGATTTTGFAGLVDGHVSLFDGTSGKLLRQLTYPTQGYVDSDPTYADGALAWVRQRVDQRCSTVLDRLDGAKAGTVASSTTVRFRQPQLSPDGQWLAWIETPCGSIEGDGGELVLTHNGAEVRRFSVPYGSVADLYDVTDDGALLVRTNDAHASGPGTIGVVPAGATTLDGKVVPLQPAAGCNLQSQAAFDGTTPVTFESCSSRVRLVRFTSGGARAGVDPSFAAEPPNSIRVRDGKYLVWLFGGDMDGPIATYDKGTFTTLVDNARAGCSSTGDQKGCVTSPDW